MIRSGDKCVPGKNTYGCPVGVCNDTVNGQLTNGTCVAQNKCQAATAGGQGVDANLSKLGQLVGMMALSQLMKNNNSSQPTPTPLPVTAGGANGCTSYYAVTTPSTDPCAYYIPPTTFGSSSLNVGTDFTSQLNSLLGGSTANNQLTSQLNAILNNSSVSGSTRTIATSSVTPVGNPGLNPSLMSSSSLLGGTHGGISVTQSGGAIYASSTDVQGNTEVAGFYGGNTVGNSKPTGVIAGLCVSRPWAGSLISYVIPSSFFDGLCSWGGYQVGQPIQQPGSTTTTIVQPIAVQPTYSTSTISAAKVLVKIWASPPTVSIGQRTLVFWNSQGAASCLVKSPDGSFNQTTLSGGASTVPLTTDTTFTISCIGADGTPATDNVTVHMAI